MLKNIVLKLIKHYQKTGGSKRWFAIECNFEPSCSFYTYEAIEKFGLYKGFNIALKRMKDCSNHDTICKCIDPITKEKQVC